MALAPSFLCSPKAVHFDQVSSIGRALECVKFNDGGFEMTFCASFCVMSCFHSPVDAAFATRDDEHFLFMLLPGGRYDNRYTMLFMLPSHFDRNK
eukprot:6191058-Pleurochrysis_carterae.AAC.1